jgi:hypothetical protein
MDVNAQHESAIPGAGLKQMMGELLKREKQLQTLEASLLGSRQASSQGMMKVVYSCLMLAILFSVFPT